MELQINYGILKLIFKILLERLPVMFKEFDVKKKKTNDVKGN